MSSSSRPLVLVQQATVTAGNKTLLGAIDLQLDTGQLLVIEGPTGCGKTTLIKMLAGLVEPSAGYAEVNGIALRPLPAASAPKLRRKLGIVTQQPRFLDDTTALENVVLPLRIQGISSSECSARGTKALLDAGLAGNALKKPSHLSGGEQARLQIARALIHQPLLVLADEPFAHLDSDSVAAAEELFHWAHSIGTAVLITTHRPTALAARGMKLQMKSGRFV
jgi:ABC-type lipoprotein export system ATPase subunit